MEWFRQLPRTAALGTFLLTVFLIQCQVCCYHIRPNQCHNKSGEKGVCMFVWECIKTDGKPLGTCADGFLFGSCCAHNDSKNTIIQSGGINTQTLSTSISEITRNPISTSYTKPSTPSTFYSPSTETFSTSTARPDNSFTMSTIPFFTKTHPRPPDGIKTQTPSISTTEITRNTTSTSHTKSSTFYSPSTETFSTSTARPENGFTMSTIPFFTKTRPRPPDGIKTQTPSTSTTEITRNPISTSYTKPSTPSTFYSSSTRTFSTTTARPENSITMSTIPFFTKTRPRPPYGKPSTLSSFIFTKTTVKPSNEAIPTVLINQPVYPVSNPNLENFTEVIKTTRVPIVRPTTSNYGYTFGTKIWFRPSTLRPSSLRPSPVRPLTVRPLTVRPSTMRPSTFRPSTFPPSTLPPSPVRPLTVRPSTANPSTFYPSTLRPSTVRPSTFGPSALRPSTVRPSTIRPSTFLPSTVHPPTFLLSTFRPSTVHPSTLRPSTFRPSTLRPLTVRPSTIRPSTARPPTFRPSTFLPSTLRASTFRPSTFRPSYFTVKKPTSTTSVSTTSRPTTTYWTSKYPYFRPSWKPRPTFEPTPSSKPQLFTYVDDSSARPSFTPFTSKVPYSSSTPIPTPINVTSSVLKVTSPSYTTVSTTIMKPTVNTILNEMPTASSPNKSSSTSNQRPFTFTSDISHHQPSTTEYDWLHLVTHENSSTSPSILFSTTEENSSSSLSVLFSRTQEDFYSLPSFQFSTTKENSFSSSSILFTTAQEEDYFFKNVSLQESFTTQVPSHTETTTVSTVTVISNYSSELPMDLITSTTMKTTTPHPISPCGMPIPYPQKKVVGGRNSAFGSWPWQASVRRTSFFGFSSTHRCGGALIHPQWVATAGHCVDDLLLSQIIIRVGEYDFSSVQEPHGHVEFAIKKKVVHPRYNFFTYENDLALVQLEKPIDPVQYPHISPICLPPSDEYLIGRNATVTGWGRLSEGGVLPTVLQEVQVPIISNEKCKDMFLAAGRHEYIPDIFMCAGFEEGGRDSCQGDSGGPLQIQAEEGYWFLAGIISWGIGCAEPNMPGVCTRISKFKDWVVQQVV